MKYQLKNIKEIAAVDADNTLKEGDALSEYLNSVKQFEYYKVKADLLKAEAYAQLEREGGKKHFEGCTISLMPPKVSRYKYNDSELISLKAAVKAKEFELKEMQGKINPATGELYPELEKTLY